MPQTLASGDIDFSRRSVATSSDYGSPRVPTVMSKRVHTYPEALDDANAAPHSFRSSTPQLHQPHTSDSELISAMISDTIHEGSEEDSHYHNLHNPCNLNRRDERILMPTADLNEGGAGSTGSIKVPDCLRQLESRSGSVEAETHDSGFLKHNPDAPWQLHSTSTSLFNTSAPPAPQLLRRSTAATLPLSKGSPQILPSSTFSQLPAINGLSLPSTSLVRHESSELVMSTSPRAQWTQQPPQPPSASGVPTTPSAVQHAQNPVSEPPPPPAVSDLTSFISDMVASSAAAHPDDPECVLLEELAPKTTTLTLHWLSPPKTVLVVCKLAPKVRPYFIRALKWFR
jgi:hypothetical protein